MQNELLICIEYLRVSTSLRVSEYACHRKVVWIGDILVKSDEFSLPKRKELLDSNEINVILVDATESPIERPKRYQKKFTQKKRRNT